jgi:energy-coupling factor transport system permease protein
MSILLPVFTSVFRRADEMALALEARGYVPGKPRTSMKELKFTAVDGFASLVILVWIAALLFLETGL